MKSSLREDFLSRVEQLKQEYPMVCVQIWTPDDFVEAETPGQLAKWEDPVHLSVSKTLGELLKEDGGSVWLKIRKAFRSAPNTPPVQ
jgi:hypothetical protein